MGVGGEFDQITRDLGVLVASGGVRLPDLEAYLVKKACDLCPGLSEEEQTSLKSIISSSELQSTCRRNVKSKSSW